MVRGLVGELEHPNLGKGIGNIRRNGLQGERIFRHVMKIFEQYEADDFNQSNVADFRCYGDNSAENLHYSLANKYIDETSYFA